MADTLRVLDQLGSALVGLTVPEADRLVATLDLARPGGAAASAAFDTSLCDVHARREGISIGQVLGGAADRPVHMNALIGAGGPVEAATAARKAVADGFRCVKLKVGAAASINAEIGRIGLVRAAPGPGVALRLDANGSWDVATAIRLIRAAACFGLELVEQPVAAMVFDGMARVRAAVDTPIAADESISGPEHARQVIDAGAADVLVVKPMCLGGLQPSRYVLRLAEKAGLRAFVTAAIDAGGGVAAAFHLSTNVPPVPLACGLATSDLLVGDLTIEPLRVRHGALQPPPGPGLGVALDAEELARYGGVWRELGG